MNILVTGATGGIGSALCEELHAQGHRLFITARHDEMLSKKSEQWNAPYQVCDVTDVKSVENLFATVANTFESLDGVAHCVGSILLKPAHITKPLEWEEAVLQNLTSSFWVLRSATKLMQKTGGCIVLTASAAGQIGLPNHDAIGARKAGVIGLTKSAAATYAKKGVRINCVAPGMVDTPLSEKILKNDAARQASENMHPLGRIGQPADVASAMAWLLCDQQSWLTGQVLGVDGGLSAMKMA